MDRRRDMNIVINRRIRQKQHNIDTLRHTIEELESESRKRKRGHSDDYESIWFNTLRDEIADQMGFYTRKEELIRQSSLSCPLLQTSDIIHHIVAHLFRMPLYFLFNNEKSNSYRPSYANDMALRDVRSLISTCHYMNDRIGPEIRRNFPLIKDTIENRCTTCFSGHITCHSCTTAYCYKCDVDHYPSKKCNHCKHINVLCACRKKTKDSDIEIRCYHCHRKLINSSFL